MMLKDPRHRVGQLQHTFQRPLGVFHPGAVGLVDHQDVRNLQDAGLDGLYVIAQPGGLPPPGWCGPGGQYPPRPGLPPRFRSG